MVGACRQASDQRAPSTEWWRGLASPRTSCDESLFCRNTGFYKHTSLPMYSTVHFIIINNNYNNSSIANNVECCPSRTGTGVADMTYRKRKKMMTEMQSVMNDSDRPTVSMMRAPNAILFITWQSHKPVTSSSSAAAAAAASCERHNSDNLQLTSCIVECLETPWRVPRLVLSQQSSPKTSTKYVEKPNFGHKLSASKSSESKEVLYNVTDISATVNNNADTVHQHQQTEALRNESYSQP